MKRITISLPDEMAALLVERARRLGTSVSDVVRRALTDGPRRKRSRGSRLPFAGIGESGARDTARRAEEILRAEWSDARRR